MSRGLFSREKNQKSHCYANPLPVTIDHQLELRLMAYVPGVIKRKVWTFSCENSSSCLTSNPVWSREIIWAPSCSSCQRSSNAMLDLKRSMWDLTSLGKNQVLTCLGHFLYINICVLIKEYFDTNFIPLFRFDRKLLTKTLADLRWTYGRVRDKILNPGHQEPPQFLSSRLNLTYLMSIMKIRSISIFSHWHIWEVTKNDVTKGCSRCP